jgi:hypothetical protein
VDLWRYYLRRIKPAAPGTSPVQGLAHEKETDMNVSVSPAKVLKIEPLHPTIGAVLGGVDAIGSGDSRFCAPGAA